MKTIEISGQKLEVEEVEFEAISEPWAQFGLEDGSIMKVRLVMKKILKVKDKLGPDGQPIYILDHQQVTSVHPRT